MTLIQYIAFFSSLCFMLAVLWTIRRGVLQEGYSLLWLLLSVMMISVSVSFKVLEILSCLTGIKTPAFAIILVLLGGMLLILFQQSIIISRQTEKLKRLTEEITLLKAEKSDKII